MVLADQPMTLSAGSMVRYSFADFVDSAAVNGFAGISVTKRLRHLAGSREGLEVADMRRMLDDRGLGVAEVEGTSDWLSAPGPSDPRALGFVEALELAAALGAPGVVIFHDERPAASQREFIADFARACDVAADHGLLVALEFLPWTPIPTLSAALSLVQGADRPNGRIVFDAWHHSHGRQRHVELTHDQGSLIFCFQLDDARAAESTDLVHETMFGRRVPGTGVLDLPSILGALDAAGVACPVAVEVYDESLGPIPARDYAAILAAATRELLSSTSQPRQEGSL
jgi:sugar phosphate isomerase/epimerase